MSYYPGYPPPNQAPYGAPPPQGYPGYPPPAGGYPQPVQQYPPGQPGYPPQQPYGQGGYPPAGPYPPPGAPYGAPPPGQYPPPQPQGYAPPPSGYAPQQPYGGYQPPAQQYYDASKDVAALRKATKGFGTDEAALINILARNKTAYQMEQIRKTFESTVGKSLVSVIEKETSGYFEYGLRGLVLGPLGFDVWLLHRACAGAGTHEDILTEVLAGRSNSDMETLKAEYQRVYNKNLVQVIQGELSFKTEQMFNMILAANRPPENFPVDPNKVEADVRALYDAGQGRIGTDEIAFCGILLNRSDAQIRQIAAEYKRHHRRSLVSAIDSEFSDHMKHTLLYVVEGALDPFVRDARLIHAAMEGVGTKDERLAYRIIRAYWQGGQRHLQGVKAAYQQKYGRNLIKVVKGETSGDFERLLVAILEG